MQQPSATITLHLLRPLYKQPEACVTFDLAPCSFLWFPFGLDDGLGGCVGGSCVSKWLPIRTQFCIFIEAILCITFGFMFLFWGSTEGVLDDL